MEINSSRICAIRDCIIIDLLLISVVGALVETQNALPDKILLRKADLSHVIKSVRSLLDKTFPRIPLKRLLIIEDTLYPWRVKSEREIAAFAERSTYINPRDGLNLNRVFPGSAGGSSSQKIADWLTHDVYRHADCVLDLHSGDVGEYVSPFAIFLHNDPRSRELALASGLDFAIGVNSGGMSIDGAAASGVPGVIPEAGGALARGGDVVDILYGGVLSALAATGIIGDAGRAPGPSRVVHDPIANYAPHHGMWYPDNEVGVFLETNAVVGRIRDYFGHETAIIRTSEPGFLLYQLVGMPVNEGEVLC